MNQPDDAKRSLQLDARILPLVVLGVFLVQIFYPFKGWVILLSGLGGMWLLSYLWARSLKNGLRIDREIRFDWKQVGDRLRERVSLENNGWAPGLWVSIDDHSDMRDYEISSVADVNGWRYQNWHTQGVCTQRGIYTLGPATLESGDPFGIYRVQVDYTDSVNMMVAPPVIALPEIEVATGERVGEGRSSIRSLKQTVSTGGVRQYVPGDSFRWLHWPTTARIGEPFVRLFDDEPTSDWWVILDMDPGVQAGEGKRSTEEYGVILAASLVNRGIQMGKNVGLVSHGNELIWHTPETGNNHLWAILRSLAKIRPGGAGLAALLQRLRSSLGARSSMIVITPNLSPAWVRALAFLKRVGVVPTVILLDPVSFGGEGRVDLFRAHLNKLNIAHYTITADYLETPQKESQDELHFLLRNTRQMGGGPGRWEVLWRKLKRGVQKWGLILIFYAVMAKILGEAVRGLELGFLRYLILSGVGLSWLAVRSKRAGWQVAFAGILTGLTFTILRVANLWGSLLNLILRGLRLIAPVLRWFFIEAAAPDLTAIQMNWGELTAGFSTLSLRFWDWLRNLIQGSPVYDPVAITFLWGLIVWGVAFWSIWGLIRKKNALSGLLPALILVIYSLATIGKLSYDVIFMLGALLGLMIFVGHDAREHIWVANRLSISATVRARTLWTGALLTLGLMIFAILTPSISLHKIIDFAKGGPRRSPAGQNVANSFGLESQAEGEVDILETSRAGGLPNEHLIGSGAELKDQVVMQVAIESYQSGLPRAELQDVLTPLYLRSLTYDRYLGYGWESRAAEILDYEAGTEIVPYNLAADHILRQEIAYKEDLGGFLMAAGTPLSVDHDFRISWRLKETIAGEYDIFGGTVNAETYRVDSLLSIFSVEELRTAGQLYPGWVRSRYLSLPQAVPDRVLALARDLTATEPTPYDRAVAIERYLRTYPYNLDVSTGPTGADIADYFLFVIGEGYCDYYATAMVVLARAAGIPARYVMGYIAENYDPETGYYTVTADQAHAWVEVYFPDLGWVPFEPTGGRPALDRPPEPFPELSDTLQIDLNPLVPTPKFSLDGGTLFFGQLLLWVAGLILGYLILTDWWLGRLSTEKLLPAIYRRIYRYGRWAGLPPQPGDTPYQYAQALNTLLAEISQGSHWPAWLREAGGLLDVVTQALVGILFNPARDDIGHRTDLIAGYKKLRRRLWLLVIMSKAYRYPVLRPIFWLEPPLLIDSFIKDEP